MATTVTALESAHSEMFTDSPLTKMLMSSEKCAEQSEDFSWKEKLYRFILIAGSRYALVTLSIFIHALIFLLGLMHYANDINGFKPLKTTSVALMVADASNLVLHFDVAAILLPVCRTLISSLEGTPLRIFLRNNQAVCLFEHSHIIWYRSSGSKPFLGSSFSLCAAPNLNLTSHV